MSTRSSTVRPPPGVVASSPVPPTPVRTTSPPREEVGHARGGLMLREGELGMLVDLATQATRARPSALTSAEGGASPEFYA